MKILGYEFGTKQKETWAQLAKEAVMQHNSEGAQASFYGESYPVYETIFDGEKTQGELGAPISYTPDYKSLSYRSWQAYTESDLAQIVVKAHVNWVIGSGLKLQSEPVEDVINSEGFNFDKEEFSKTTEQRFSLYSKSNSASYSKMYNFQTAQRIAYLNAAVGGDVLCVQRLEDGLPSIQLIDGIFIEDPGADILAEIEQRGNQIVHGVEIGKNGEHLRFYVAQKEPGKYTTIEAKGKNTGKLQAYLIYGSEYRIDSVRGMPLLSAVLEKMKMLDRYNNAVVGGAEERAKVPYVFEHTKDSTGVNPDLAPIQAAMTGNDNPSDATVVDMTAQMQLVKKTYQKDAINLPVGAAMKKLDGGMETGQEAFTTGNFIYICAAVEVPYEVALMKYVNSFSSSRMASQSWLTILHIKRTLFNDTFNKPLYNFFLDTQILLGKIKADGYFSAVLKKDVILLEAYRNCRFIGPGVPQADPSKEVKAEVSKIEANLTTYDNAIERLGGGDSFDTVVDRLAVERQMLIDKMPKKEEEEVDENTNN